MQLHTLITMKVLKNLLALWCTSCAGLKGAEMENEDVVLRTPF